VTQVPATLWRLDDRGAFRPVRITRITGKRVHLLAVDLEDRGEPAPIGPPAMRLRRGLDARLRERSVSRADLERDGIASCAKGSVLVYTAEAAAKLGPGPTRVRANAALALLGLSMPCTIESVHSAYRLRAKTAHPDCGGSVAEFIQLRRAYEHALTAVRA
jgi:hypothetical protein